MEKTCKDCKYFQDGANNECSYCNNGNVYIEVLESDKACEYYEPKEKE